MSATADGRAGARAGRHVLLRDPGVFGWEYGVLRAFEDEIVRQTGADVVELKPNPLVARWARRLNRGGRWTELSTHVPKRKLVLPADTRAVWSILMSPHESRQHLFSGWQRANCRRLVYIFDTLPSQIPWIPRSLVDAFDIRITSFNDAVPLLERATSARWFHVDQAASLAEFRSVPGAEKVIHFAAYGRRQDKAHEATKLFCRSRDLFYDYSTHPVIEAWAKPEEFYHEYAWHLSHAQFVYCWPVELTSPSRARELRPITCRWFEAVAAGAVTIGAVPDNPHFRKVFGDDFVQPLDVSGSVDAVVAQLEQLWSRREALLHRAAERRRSLAPRVDWSCRVQEMLALLETAPEGPGP